MTNILYIFIKSKYSRHLTCLWLILLLPLIISGQISDSLESKQNHSPTKLDFLFHYYDQDGDHAAVTGGIGTEKLSDYDSRILINIPLDSISQLHLNGSVNIYTSASTDRIDAVISSASSEDIHTELYVDWEEAPTNKRYRYGLGVGGATESDYLSGSIRGFIAWISKDQSREFQITSRLFFDRWQLFFPDELRGTSATIVDTDRRNAYTLGLGLTQIIRPRWQAALQSELSFQHGLLSTPFHRVYFAGENRARIERFPNTRWRIPISAKLHYFWGDFLINRLFYRFYWDSFGLNAHTLQLGLAFKMGNSFTLSPAYRYYTQTASRYFAPFEAHPADALFYSSDYDLSAFYSQQWTLGLKYAPLYGIGRWRSKDQTKAPLFKSWELRVLRYIRSDGLQAFGANLGLGFGW